MLKDSYWKEAFLFQDFLFEMNIGIYKELERVINALGIITKNAATMTGKVGEEYGLIVKQLFLSAVDFFDVSFHKLIEMMESCKKKTTAGGRAVNSFLRFQNCENFFDKVGDHVLVGSTSKRAEDIKSIKFFKILIFYSKGFVDFLRYVYENKTNDDESKLMQTITLLT